MGIYKDHDIKFISFFHEMGHILIPEEEIEKCKTKYDVEERAWRYGMDLAESLNVRFSYDAIQWAKRQLKSYRIK